MKPASKGQGTTLPSPNSGRVSLRGGFNPGLNNTDIFMGFDRHVSFPIRRSLMVIFPVAFFVFIVFIVFIVLRACRRDWKRTSRKRPKRFHVGRGLFLGCMEPINILWKVFHDNKLKPGSSLSSRDSQYILGLPPFLPPPPPLFNRPGSSSGIRDDM